MKKINPYIYVGLTGAWANDHYQKKNASIDRVLNIVSRVYGLDVGDVLGHNRRMPLPDARCMAVALLSSRHEIGHHPSVLGMALNKSHCTIIYYLRRHDNRVRFNKGYKERWNELEGEYIAVTGKTVKQGIAEELKDQKLTGVKLDKLLL
jgi:chromosomal replication initiation ATPase DnaA